MIYTREAPENLDSNTGKLTVHLYFDTMDDYDELPGLDKAAPGSDAFCVDTGDAYILRKDTGEWDEI